MFSAAGKVLFEQLKVPLWSQKGSAVMFSYLVSLAEAKAMDDVAYELFSGRDLFYCNSLKGKTYYFK